MILGKLDSLLERGADALERFAHDLARENGFKRQLGEELAEDAAFLRNLTPTRVAERARGESPTEPVTPEQVATQVKESLPAPAPTAGPGPDPAPAAAPPSPKPPSSGPNPFAVIGIAFVAGFAVARLIAWRSDAYPRH
jgi:hypothetical protein